MSLSNRNQVLQISRTLNDNEKIKCPELFKLTKVLQRTLGSILFLLYMHNLFQFIDLENNVLYTDDVSLLTTGKAHHEAESNLNMSSFKYSDEESVLVIIVNWT